MFVRKKTTGKLSLEISRLYASKGRALKKRLGELKKAGRKDVTEPALARHLKKDSRVTVAQWKAGKNWPSPIEEQEMEKFLELPATFFIQVGKGVPYDDALKAPVSSEEKEPEPEPMAATLYRQFTEIYGASLDDAPEVLFAHEHRRLLGEYVNLVHKIIVRQKIDDFTKKRQSRSVPKNDRSGETGSETP